MVTIERRSSARGRSGRGGAGSAPPPPGAARRAGDARGTAAPLAGRDPAALGKGAGGAVTRRHRGQRPSLPPTAPACAHRPCSGRRQPRGGGSDRWGPGGAVTARAEVGGVLQLPRGRGSAVPSGVPGSSGCCHTGNPRLAEKESQKQLD
ncbi:translation initiation factor IF-2 [Chiroxiphia lanceolata]|uniref:translation initiation factor IF-2 n=1 Tax=Chiroxiphia lanceolata TaxID=296741 RepID=UPI0013CE6CFA|nr:translation initiation factor IF-2 [Chiroxiphia lanceolata]